jgi:hypothetical protein
MVTGGGVTVTVVERTIPLRVADTTTGVGEATGLVGNDVVVLVSPPGTITRPGVGIVAASLDVTAIDGPSTAAGASIVATAVAVSPPTTGDGLTGK